MKDQPTITTNVPTRTTGVLPGVVHFALDVTERSQSAAIGALQDARIEVRAAFEGSLDLVEKLAAAAIRYSRKLVHRVDDTSNEALIGIERVLGGVVKSARETTQAAQQLATATVHGVAGRAAA